MPPLSGSSLSPPNPFPPSVPLPSLIIIPGAWHTSATFAPLIGHLTIHHFRCIPVDLPSKSHNPHVTLQDDIACVRRLIALEISSGHHTILLAHSYGGFVASSAVRDFTPNKNPKSSATIGARPPGHVIGLILIASPFAKTGVEFTGGFKQTAPQRAHLLPSPAFRPDPITGFLILTTDPRELFYNDMPPVEAGFWSSRLVAQAARPMCEGGEYVYAGWKDCRVWYVCTVNDRAFPVGSQRFFVDEARAGGGRVVVREINSGHAPMLSRTRELVGIVMEGVEWFLKDL